MCLKTNLSIFPLAHIARISGVQQKCLLPASILPSSFRCGTWAKCKLNSLNAGETNEGSAICQIYEQTSMEQSKVCAFIDTTVTINSNPIDIQSSRLLAVEPLMEETEDVGVVELVIVLKKNYLQNAASKWNLRKLQESCKMLLQAYQLTSECCVTSQQFAQLGIKAINICARHCKPDKCFAITESTIVNIIDVRLDATDDMLSAPSLFYAEGCQAGLLELKNLLERSRNKQLRSSLNALLIGPTGCGKSALMLHFAKTSECNYFRVTTQDILGQYPGETESKLRRIFDGALKFVEHFKPKAPTLIHIEDVQLLCPAIKAGSTKDAGMTLRLCAQLCALLDKLHHSNSGIMCVATAIDSKSLHKSLHMPGRFQHEIEIEPLNDLMRLKLFLSMLAARFPQQLACEHVAPQNLHAEIAAMTTLKACKLLPADKLDLFVGCTHGFVAADLALLVRSIEQAKLRNNSLQLFELVDEMLRKAKPTSLRGSDVTVVKSKHGLESIGGMEMLKRTLELKVLTGMQRAEAYKRFGLSLPKGILLYGPPGCAKTSIAKCLAAEAKMTFIATSGAEVYSPYVGCAEKFISKLFDTARKHAPCLIFLDEIDTLVGNRSQSSNDVQTRILSTLLTEMDGIVQTRLAAEAYILVVAATNRPHMIDDALLRPGRFDQLIHVPAPDCESRLSIFELHKQRMPFAADCVLTNLAERTNNFSGADICNLCNEAAMHAFQRDFDAVEITQQDFDSVLKTLRPSLTQRQIDAYFEFKKSNFS